MLLSPLLSEISMNEIDESSLALLAGLSHRHMAGGEAGGEVNGGMHTKGRGADANQATAR